MSYAFISYPEVKIICDRFEHLPSFDCFVPAGNSFGLMDAGMDLAVVRVFRRYVMERVQKQILDVFLGERPVGTCIIVPTGHPRDLWTDRLERCKLDYGKKYVDRVHRRVAGGAGTCSDCHPRESLSWRTCNSHGLMLQWLLSGSKPRVGRLTGAFVGRNLLRYLPGLSSELLLISRTLRHFGLMWAFVCAGPYPTNLNFKPYGLPVKPRKSWAIRENSVKSAVLRYLRSNPGREITLDELEAETGHPRARISMWFANTASKSERAAYLEPGIITRRGKGIYRYEEPPLANT